MKNILPILILVLIINIPVSGQKIVRTVDIFNSGSVVHDRGELFIYQSPSIDTLISRHIEANRLAGGIDGYRIQVYRKGHRNAREEADKIMAKVISEFPELQAYQEFERPNFYLVRIGDFRTKIEATRALAIVRNSFSDSYLVKQKINLPEVIN